MVNLRPFEVTEATRGRHFEKKVLGQTKHVLAQCVLALDGIMVNGIMFFFSRLPH